MRYAAIHAHFYQPPRENPWRGTIDPEQDAAPHRDWNTRIASECYRPNVSARLLDEEGAVRAVRNNYADLGFNVGPTLAAWLQAEAPATWSGMMAGDRAHRDGGDDRAVLAQPYAHPILPLCTPREKRLQILWGVQDFEHRFGRKPPGLWLPETAVDHETLETAAELDLGFTLLAPHQATRIQNPDGGTWRPLEGDLPSHRAYRQELSRDRSIDLLFYDRRASQAVAFEDALTSGTGLAATITARLADLPADEAALLLVATDGETFGHHHRFGEMALAAVFEALEQDEQVRPTTPGQYLARHEPRWLVDIAPRTSWSCPHGVMRWHTDCGCGSGDGDAAWRTPLRDTLENLRDRMEELLLTRGRRALVDPEAAAEAYGAVVADPTPERLETFLARHARRSEDPAARRAATSFMQMQRHALLMFSSCGWFFGALDRPEPVLCLRHATRAAELADSLGGVGTEEALVDDLARVPGDTSEVPDGAALWKLRVEPARGAVPARGDDEVAGR